jgi:molecular chaperone DnaK
VPGEERAKVESALSDLKGVIKGDDKDKIEKKLEALMQASQSLAQMAYAAQAGGPEAAPSGDKGDSDVLDAEFEEVKGDDKDRKAS